MSADGADGGCLDVSFTSPLATPTPFFARQSERPARAPARNPDRSSTRRSDRPGFASQASGRTAGQGGPLRIVPPLVSIEPFLQRSPILDPALRIVEPALREGLLHRVRNRDRFVGRPILPHVLPGISRSSFRSQPAPIRSGACGCGQPTPPEGRSLPRRVCGDKEARNCCNRPLKSSSAFRAWPSSAIVQSCSTSETNPAQALWSFRCSSWASRWATRSSWASTRASNAAATPCPCSDGQDSALHLQPRFGQLVPARGQMAFDQGQFFLGGLLHPGQRTLRPRQQGRDIIAEKQAGGFRVPPVARRFPAPTAPRARPRSRATADCQRDNGDSPITTTGQTPMTPGPTG